VWRSRRPNVGSDVPTFLEPRLFDAHTPFLVDQFRIVTELGKDPAHFVRDIFAYWLSQPGRGDVLEREGHPFARFLQDLKGLSEWWTTNARRAPAAPTREDEPPPVEQQHALRANVGPGAAAVAAAATAALRGP
jgi:hypothetical protein